MKRPIDERSRRHSRIITTYLFYLYYRPYVYMKRQKGRLCIRGTLAPEVDKNKTIPDFLLIVVFLVIREFLVLK